MRCADLAHRAIEVVTANAAATCAAWQTDIAHKVSSVNVNDVQIRWAVSLANRASLAIVVALLLAEVIFIISHWEAQS